MQNSVVYVTHLEDVTVCTIYLFPLEMSEFLKKKKSLVKLEHCSQDESV